MKKNIIIALLLFTVSFGFAENENSKKSNLHINADLTIDGKKVSFDLNNISEEKMKEAARAFIRSYYKNNKEKREALLKILEKENAKFNISTDKDGNIIINEIK
ncbi:MAG: hypothetical protein U0U67_02360 [Chitinophagales bacterium]